MEKAQVNHGENGWEGKLRHDGGPAGPSLLAQGRKKDKRRLQAVRATAPAALAAQAGVSPNPATTTTFVALPTALGSSAKGPDRACTVGTVRAFCCAKFAKPLLKKGPSESFNE